MKFSTKKCGNTFVFYCNSLAFKGRKYDFRLYVTPERKAMFKVFKTALPSDMSGSESTLDINGKGAGVPVQVPSVAETLLGAPYQDIERLGYAYGEVPWYANILHELVHVWYVAARYNELSPNHAMLMEMCDTPMEQCDDEEVIVTGFQVYANTESVPYRSFEMISPSDAECWRYFNDSRDFINWAIEQIAQYERGSNERSDF